MQITHTPAAQRVEPAIKDIDDFTYDDIEVVGYEHHPHIKAPISV